MRQRLSALIAGLILSSAATTDSLAQTLEVARRDATDELHLSVGSERIWVRTSTDSIEDPTVRSRPGELPLAITWTERALDDSSSDWYALSPDGRSLPKVARAHYDLELLYARHDPRSASPAVPADYAASPESRLAVVQLWVPAHPAFQATLEQEGAELHLALAHQALVVSLAPGTRELIAALPFVRSIAPYHPAYKLEPGLLQLAGAPLAAGELRVNVLSMRRGPLGQAPVAALVRSLGGRVEDFSRETFLMSVTVPLGALPVLAASDEVQWIDRWTPAELDMDLARAFHGANFIESTLGYTGLGVRVEVMDGGCDTIHPDIQNFVVHAGNTPSAHGTCTSGIVVGSGAGNAAARGVMPDAFLSIADYSYYGGGSRYAHTGELQDPALVYRAVLQSNSWGNARTFNYTSVSQDMDLILFDHDRISILQSQSNAGNQDSRPQAWAKNIISVGGVRHYNTLVESDDAWNFGASIGPAADGRIKPDLSSFYDATLCTDQVGSAGYTSSNYYSSFGGTSGATPIVAGHLGLVYEMWADEVFGNSAPGTTVFDDRPYNTTAKALLINTASQWNFSGTGHDLTRVHQGWGRPDLAQAYALRDELVIVDESVVLAPLDSSLHAVQVQAGTPALKATLVYRDNPGTTSSSLHRINDLDLKLTSPGGTVYWGNNGLLASMWSTAGGSPNTLDTVENVFVQSPASGTWLVEVIASDLVQDTHVETPGIDADYALVVSGATDGPPPAPVASFSGSPLVGFVPLEVTFNDQSSGAPTSWSWSFGDGGTSNVQHPVHTYTAAGTYTVALTVSAPGGSDTLTEVDYIEVQVQAPPAAPSGLSAAASSSSAIDLNWVDNSPNEDNFELERSLDQSNWSLVAQPGAGSTSYSDGGLAALTSYYYRVRAVNTAGNSAWSNSASAQTTGGSTTTVTALSETTIAGTSAGGLAAAAVEDGSYEVLTERESGGKPANRHSYLEHRWTFDVPAGSSLTLGARAYRTNLTSEVDDFRFEWSTSGSSWTTAFTVDSDIPEDYTATLPGSVVGSLQIRVVDTLQLTGQRVLDSVYVDHLFLEVTGVGGGLPPGAPLDLIATAVSAEQIELTWTDGSNNETGFEVERSLDGLSWSAPVSAPANTGSYTDTGLSASTEYFYRVRAVNANGASGWSNVTSATTLGTGAQDVTANAETASSGTVSGSYLDTHSLNGVFQSITERESGGKPANRYSYLEHQWQFSVPTNDSVELRLRGYATDFGEGDEFEFDWSTDGSNWMPGITLANTNPSVLPELIHSLGSGLAGTLYVRVRDADRTPGNRELDTVFIDHLFLRVQ